MKNDSSQLKSSISKWCADALNRIDHFNVDETDKVLKSAVNLVDPLSDQANFLGKVFIKSSSIGVIKTKELKGTKVLFNNQTANRVNSLVDRLNQLSSAAQHVNNKIKFTKATQRTRRQTPALIKTLTVDGPLNIQSINGKSVADLVYKSNRRNKRLQDIVVKEILISQELFVNGQVDGVEIMEDNVILDTATQVLRPMRIEKLTTGDIEVSNVNGLPFPEFFALLKQKAGKKVPRMIDELNAETLSVGRFLNQQNFTAIAIHSLKTSGDQFIDGFKNIGKLKANRVMFGKVLRDQTISKVPLAMLIDINDARQRLELNRDMRFTNDLIIDRLIVNERINNIKVKEGQLQVLRKRGLTHQVVTGEKFFDKINLLSPIVLRGKIESKSLQKMNPIITINKDVVELQGDYRITGPVTIRRIIQASDDIKSTNPKLGLKNLIDNGLNLFTTNVTSNNLVFQGVVNVERNLEALSLNQKPVANFVKANFPEQQTIHGMMTFNNGLMVHDGTVQADFINDVEINQLNKTILKRFSSVPQFIDGNLEIVSLQTPQLFSSDVNLNGKSIDLVLNTNQKQNLVQVLIPQARVVNMNATNVQQGVGGKVFKEDLNFLINDAVTKKSLADGSVLAEKYFTDLKVNHLMFSDENEWKSIIANYENSIAQDVNVTGPFVFNSDMKVDSLIYTGTLNGIAYQDMIANWLQVEGDQVFTAPQTINSMTVESNLGLSKEMINNVNIATMIKDSIWIDGPISLEEVEIEGEATVWGETMTPTVNGIILEEKILLNNTNEQQTIPKFVLERGLTAEYINFSSLNGIDCLKLTEAFVGESETTNLRVFGNVRFNYQPNVHSINYVGIKELYENVWLTHRDVVLTGDDIHFLGNVIIHGSFSADVSFHIFSNNMTFIGFSLSVNQ